jgi:glycosyltransferase involved in cell wall biosynthesis
VSNVIPIHQDTGKLPLGLTVIVPVFNEASRICEALCELVSVDVNFPFEIIVINDGSTDNTRDIIKWPMHLFHIRFIDLPENKGKGHAVRLGISLAEYSHALVFDADLEYFGHDIPRLFRPIQMGVASIVYGVRIRGINSMHPSFIFALGRRVLTAITNILYGTAITDLHTCLKLFPVDFLRSIELTESGFGLDTQMTALALRNGLKPFEIPITYVGRTASEGKKIKFSHAFECVSILVRCRLSKPLGYQVKKYAKRNINFVQQSSEPLYVVHEDFA